MLTSALSAISPRPASRSPPKLSKSSVSPFRRKTPVVTPVRETETARNRLPLLVCRQCSLPKAANSVEVRCLRGAPSLTARTAARISPLNTVPAAAASSIRSGSSASTAARKQTSSTMTRNGSVRNGDGVVFLSAVRTPFGTFGGKLKDFSPVELAVHASKAAIERSGADASDIDQTIFGNVLYTTRDSIYFARHVGLRSGLRQETSALTVNRLCGSGFQAVVSGAQEILFGDAQMCLVGGAESMSQAPHVTRGLRWGTPLGKSPVLEDVLWESLTDSFVGLGMAETAENLAEKYELDRGCVDEFALRSQQRAKAAWEEGVFKDEVVPVPFTDPRGKTGELAVDEHMRPGPSAEKLATPKPVFRKGGVVTAGNASGIGDGPAGVVVANREVGR